MKLPESKIENAVASGKQAAGRLYMLAPWLDADNKCLVATDGRIMALAPVELDGGDTSGPVPLDALKAARKLGGVGGNPATLLINSVASTSVGAQFPRPGVGQYPDYRRVVPQAPDREPDLVIDAELLYRLAKAIGNGKTPNIALWFPEHYGSPIRVEPRGVRNTSQAYGCIMPCRKG